ncbi:putative osmotically inducible protein [Indibacter alkaliphilus LW1]|jgi:osmotically inducible protein OsmC|uniref:Osmotically inducible protein n=1 Tax=Indibacter alkaliphilus (strain CCUG 57479 / KCTC 22604 / LW1) TaxID=1189612 RepID=S2DHK7_INDAL|nr:OsmC family protein [Indibacter alkaliphilus]EOZ98474.1 putative osmotically inducible protein [Indibacter alkaliphilus LW1]
MKRHATAVWQGSGKEGKGKLSTQTGVLENTQYSFSSRFEDGKGTNPEELIAAAHAGCFAMKLSFSLGEAGFTADELNAKCTITLADGKITKSKIDLDAKVPDISEDEFSKAVKDAEENCPISVLLDTEIVVEYSLSK